MPNLTVSNRCLPLSPSHIPSTLLLYDRQADERRTQREDIIRDLETKPYLTGEDEERLARLRLDSEFERRAEQARKEDTRDSDDDDLVSEKLHCKGDNPPPMRLIAAEMAMVLIHTAIIH